MKLELEVDGSVVQSFAFADAKEAYAMWEVLSKQYSNKVVHLIVRG